MNATTYPHAGPVLADGKRQMPIPAPIRIDAEFVTYRLEEAGATLLALPGSGPSMSRALPSAMPDVVLNAAESYGWSGMALRPCIPNAARITRMDEALGWILLIPLDPQRPGSGDLAGKHGGAQLRRIIGARCLVSPVTERHLFSWRRIGGMIGASHVAALQWHGRGIDVIVKALRAKGA